MNKYASIFLALVILALSPVARPVQAGHAVVGDPDKGRRIAYTCQACHGETGMSDIDGFPNIAGQHQSYMVKQLIEMRDAARERAGRSKAVDENMSAYVKSKRSNEVMDEFVVDLSDDDIRDVAAYYSQQSCADAPDQAVPPPPKFEIRCQVCHGAKGHAKNSNLPNIAGQNYSYLVAQMEAFRASALADTEVGGKRRRAIMESQVRELSDQDIANVSLYYSRLSCSH